MKPNHIHKFKKIGMTIYCSCGVIKDLICAHRWIFKENQSVQFDKAGGVIHQTIEYSTCKICGGLRYLNKTSGECKITR